MAEVRLVVDSGPCIALSRVGLLGILETTFDEVLVPRAVFDELVAGSNLDEAWRIVQLKNASLLETSLSQLVARNLGDGERAALSYALETGASVLLDDGAGRAEARRLALPVLGTLSILRIAHAKGALRELHAAVTVLRDSGYRLPLRVVNEMLAEVGETPLDPKD